jgi:hypothetical protein
MTQSGYAVKLDNKQWEDYESLKKNMGSYYDNIREYKREIPQTCADAAANIEEVSGETLAAMSDETVIVYQKTDQVGTDGGATGTVTWATDAGVKTDATFTLDGTDTTTAVALVAATGAAADHIESFALDSINCADEVILGNSGKTEVYAVIKTGQFQCLKSKFMAGYGRRTFIGKLHVGLNLTTALVTLVCTFTPVGETLSTTKTFYLKSEPKTWEPVLEVAAGTEISWTIEDDNAAHPVANVELTYLEAWND